MVSVFNVVYIIFSNEIYTGEYTWNKSQWVKDPDTGVRKRIERPQSEWQRQHLPELQIVSSELWAAAQSRMRGPRMRTAGRPQRSPWSGLLRCGYCGGPINLVNKRLYGCSRHKDRGAAVCRGVMVKRGVVEGRLVDITRDHLLSNDSIEQLRAEVARLCQEQAGTAGQQASAAKKRLADLEREISNLVDAVAAAPWSMAILSRLKTAEAERAQTQAELAAQYPAPTAEILPRLMEMYRAKLENLPDALEKDADKAREALRDLVGEVVVFEEDNEVWAEIPSYAGGLFLNMVAGGRFSIKKRYRIA